MQRKQYGTGTELTQKMSITNHALLIASVRHPLAGVDVMAEAVELIKDLGGEDTIEGGRLVVLNEAGQEIGDRTEELAFTLSHSSENYVY